MKNVKRFIKTARKHIDHIEFHLNPKYATEPYSRYPRYKKFKDITVAEFLQGIFTLATDYRCLNARFIIGNVGLQTMQTGDEDWAVIDVDTGEVVVQFGTCSEIMYTNDFGKKLFKDVV